MDVSEIKLYFIFAVLLANLTRPIVCQIFKGSRDLRHVTSRKNFYRARSVFPRRSYTKFEVSSSNSFEDR